MLVRSVLICGCANGLSRHADNCAQVWKHPEQCYCPFSPTSHSIAGVQDGEKFLLCPGGATQLPGQAQLPTAPSNKHRAMTSTLWMRHLYSLLYHNTCDKLNLFQISYLTSTVTGVTQPPNS